ncbi:acyl-CoA N-acyltransferase [Aspergillus crustosus]
MAIWRNLTPVDIPALMHVADTVHPGLPEHAEVFNERIRLYPEGYLALENENNGQVCGYAISHPIRYHQLPALDTLLGEISSNSDQYYIHDIVILPSFQGYGLAGQCVRRLLDVGKQRGFESSCLVSVYGTERFWARFGFQREDVGDDLREKIRGYGGNAVYLSRMN